VRWPPNWQIPSVEWNWPVHPDYEEYYDIPNRLANLEALRVNNNHTRYLFPGPADDKDASPPPDPNYCLEGRDFVRQSWGFGGPPLYYEIGRDLLEESLEAGERLDFEFAKRMQGLLGGPLAAVWDCLDPSFNPADRGNLLAQFLGSYGRDFHSQMRFEEGIEARAVVTEAMQQHQAFCQVLPAPLCVYARVLG
jgi:hypothetical protein